MSTLEYATAHYRQQLRAAMLGSPWLVVMDVQVAAAHTAQLLQGLGVERVFSLATSRGTGELPGEDELP